MAAMLQLLETTKQYAFAPRIVEEGLFTRVTKLRAVC